MSLRQPLRSLLPVMGLLMFFLLSFSCPSYSQITRIVMVTENWPPFRISDESSPSGFRGIDIDIAERLSEALDIKIEIERHPWARALEQIRNGKADIITGIAYAKERETDMCYVPVSYSSVRPVFYTRKGQGKLIQSYGDLYSHSVGYSINSIYFEPFDSDPRISKTGLSTEEQLLRVLALGRINVIIGTDPNISYETARLGYSDILEPTEYQPSAKTDLYIAISRKSQAMTLADKIEQALVALKNNGTIDRILDSYR